jgi:uroporphyrinogen-III synthase
VLGALPLTGCILRAPGEAEAFAAGVPVWGRDAVAWCLGEGTARRARSAGWVKVVEAAAGDGWRNLIKAMEERRAFPVGS